MGAFALHVQCPWRIISREAIVTGSDDYWQPAPTVNKVDWTAGGSDPSLQEKRLLDLFLGYDPETKSCENITGLLYVEAVDGDVYGGVEIRLSGGYSLQLIPAATNEDPFAENWRLLQPYGPHFVARPNNTFEEEPSPVQKR